MAGAAPLATTSVVTWRRGSPLVTPGKQPISELPLYRTLHFIGFWSRTWLASLAPRSSRYPLSWTLNLSLYSPFLFMLHVCLYFTYILLVSLPGYKESSSDFGAWGLGSYGSHQFGSSPSMDQVCAIHMYSHHLLISMSDSTPPQATLWVASHNTQGLNPPIKQHKAFHNYHSRGIDILLLQETHFLENYILPPSCITPIPPFISPMRLLRKEG